MTENLTNSDIDRIFKRIEERIDLSKIKNKIQFSDAIESISSNRFWNKKLNDFFWDIAQTKEKIERRIPEITLPATPIELLTPVQKRERTIGIKKQIISVSGSAKQIAYTRRMGRRWDNIEINFAKKLKRDGLTYKQIAFQLNRTKSSVSTKLIRIRKLKRKI